MNECGHSILWTVARVKGLAKEAGRHGEIVIGAEPPAAGRQRRSCPNRP